MPTLAYDINALQRAKLGSGLSFDEIAAASKCSTDTACRFVNSGRARPSTARRIAKTLNVKLADLVPHAPASIPAGGHPTRPAALSNGSESKGNIQPTTNGAGQHVPASADSDTQELKPDKVRG